MLQSGTVTLAGREFSGSASGTATKVKTIYFEEIGMHPKVSTCSLRWEPGAE
jgi:hypothetical protein